MRVYYILLILFLGLSSCEDKPVTIVLQNPANIERMDECFVISRTDLKVNDNILVPIIKNIDGTYVPCQLDDIDKDGVWDELAFVYTLKANERIELIIDLISVDDYPDFKKRTNIRYGKMIYPGHVEELNSDSHGKTGLPRGTDYPYQMDGPAWENDKIAFRHYFDGRNCRDLFGKKVSEMILDTVGIDDDGNPANTYQTMSDWGLDILSVAGSFGIGGLAIEKGDSLARLGITYNETTDVIDSTRYELLVEGPVRSIFKLEYKSWNIGDANVDIQEYITMWAGKYGYEEVVHVSGLPQNANIITGIPTNLLSQEPIDLCLDSGWRIMATFDRQTVNVESCLGMAIVFPKLGVKDFFKTPHNDSWCARLLCDSEGFCKFHVLAGWEYGPEPFTDKEQFMRMVRAYAEMLSNPSIVIIK